MSWKGHKGVQGPVGHQAEPSDVNREFGDEQNLTRVREMVAEAMKSEHFAETLEKHYKKLEDDIAECIMKSESDMPAGQSWNLSSPAACKMLAGKIVNNVLRTPYETEDRPLVSGEGVWNGGEECPF